VDPIAHYHHLLEDPELAAESQAMLDDQLARRDMVFGGRPLCTVLRPRLTTPRALRTTELRVRALLGAFAKAYAMAIADRAFRAQFLLADWEETLIAYEPGIRNPSPTSRLDTFIVDAPDELKLTEYNAETPAGAAFNDALADAFIDIPVMREFARRYSVRPLQTRHGVLHVLLDAFAEWRGRRDAPRVAIVDWHGVPTETEFRLFREYLTERGLSCVRVDPHDADYHDGALYFDGKQVDLIYKRVLISELVERCGIDGPIVRAVRDRAVCMVNGFRSKILHKKASLAVLSDERNAHLFTADQRAAIEAHIPWTRTVQQRRTMHGGRDIDLIEFTLAARDQLVLKPNDDYGGAGIVLGWTVDAATWEQAIRKALDEPFIVQERVRIPFEAYPSYVSGSVKIFNRMQDTAPFVSYGEFMEGCLTRLSTAELLNVTAGGGSQVPTFVVEER
jgi:uncharacterized circularly permuted ATP-grasp superfamily protein